MIYNGVLELIGNTPILKLTNMIDKDSADVYVKLEKFNPGGSIKDRASLGMIEKAESEGKDNPQGRAILKAIPAGSPDVKARRLCCSCHGALCQVP